MRIFPAILTTLVAIASAKEEFRAQANYDVAGIILTFTQEKGEDMKIVG